VSFTVLLILFCLVGLCLALLGESRDRISWSLAGKLMAASAYLAVAFVEGAWTSDWGRVLLLGMLFCWAGDLLLVSKQRGSLFLVGLVSFLVGHVFYSLAFVVRGVSADGMLLPVALVAVFVFVVQRWLRPHLDGAMVLPVHAYLGAISIMWLLAIATHAAHGGLTLLVGASLFVVSDLSVARNRFVAPALINRLWGLPVYFSAQMLLALSSAGG
jgi:uncharacterized membrane protein YhhN